MFLFSIRKKDVSFEKNIKNAVTICLPLVYAAVKDIQKGVFPKSCLLNIEIPSCPLANKVCFSPVTVFLENAKAIEMMLR